MPDDTVLQFAGAPDAAGGPVRPEEPERAGTVCPGCAHQFSGDARFCPFDGAPLEARAVVDPAGDRLVGTVVDGRYRVERVLGEGGMGTVYRVRHQALGRPFALKALKHVFARDAELSARFIREAKAAAAVGHPNVVQITDFGSLESGQPYFVMEMLEGDSLAGLIRRGGPIPAGRAVRMLTQIVEALAAAHESGVIHRDLKPDNIHVGSAKGSDNDIVKVLDFGLAKVAGGSKLTRQGMVFGTPHYMSPEQASGDPVDHRADIYALGVVMYEMFTGRVPFEADTYMGVLTKHMYMAPTPPSQLVTNAKDLGALEDVTLKCLEKKSENRHASMKELLAELEHIVNFTETGEVDVRPSQAGNAPRPRNLLADELEPPTNEEMSLAMRRAGIPPPGSSRGAVGFAIAGGVALLVALAFLWIQRGDGQAGGGAPATSARTKAAARESEPKPAPAAAEPAPYDGPKVTPVGGPSIEAATPPPALRPVRGAAQSAPARPSGGAARPPARRPERPGKKAIGGGEIVNPWSD